MFSLFEVVDAIYVDDLPPFLSDEITKNRSDKKNTTICNITDDHIVEKSAIEEKRTNNPIFEDKCE